MLGWQNGYASACRAEEPSSTLGPSSMIIMKEKAVCLVSGGIDSPVALAMMAKKYEVIPLHFCLYPFYCKGSFETMIRIMKKLKEKTKFKKMIIYPHGEILSRVLKSGNEKYMCILCRKAMFKAAEKICEGEGASAIVTGESLAQKASQTLPNLAATGHNINYPLLRPLLAYDKIEIENLSKKMGIWSESHVGCCSAVPERPATRAKIEIAERLFERLELEKIIDNNFKKILKLKSLDKFPSRYLSSFLKMS